jgi:hypothetical protein
LAPGLVQAVVLERREQSRSVSHQARGLAKLLSVDALGDLPRAVVGVDESFDMAPEPQAQLEV